MNEHTFQSDRRTGYMRKPYLFLLTIVVFSMSICAQARWLEQSMQTALDHRDAYYTLAGIDKDPARSSLLWTVAGASDLQKKVLQHQSPGNPWVSFLYGLAASHQSSQDASGYFEEALRITESDAGQTWALFVECHLTHQDEWASATLRQLEKSILIAGAQGSSLVAIQLAMLAQKERATGDVRHRAQILDDWSLRFEQGGVAYHIRSAARALPGSIPLFAAEISNVISIVSASWHLQVYILWTIWQGFTTILAFLSLGIFAGLVAVALPAAAHKLSYVFPAAVPIQLRTFLTIIVIASTISFGPVACAVVLFLVLWPALSPFRRTLLTIAAAVAVLAPINARVESLFHDMLSSNSSLGLLQRAQQEGYSPSLLDTIIARSATAPSDVLLLTAAATLEGKSRNYVSAESYCSRALKLAPNDPLVQTTAGNVAFLSGDPRLARERYNSCLAAHPAYQAALFNLGQINLTYASSATGEENISSATSADPALTSAFVGKNAEYFAESWPRNRLLMQAEPSAEYIWKTVFPHAGSWDAAYSFWAAEFFGIPPLPSLLGLGAGVLLFASLVSARQRRRQVPTLFFCSICGAPMCKRCRTGSLCTQCVAAIESVQSEMDQQEVKVSIKIRQRRIFHIASGILDLLFPGAGGIYRRSSPSAGAILTLFATSIVYTIYATCLVFPTQYPFGFLHPLIAIILVPAGIYTVVATLVAIRRIAQASNARLT